MGGRKSNRARNRPGRTVETGRDGADPPDRPKEAAQEPAAADRCPEIDPADAEEAPAGFDNKTNGFEDQDAFDKDREAFEEEETVLPNGRSHGGLGPVYNAASCVAC